MSDALPVTIAHSQRPSVPQPPERRPGGVFLSLRKLMGDRSGVGAVEFAILAPILIALYICCFELTMAFSFAKRSTRAAGTVGDLVTQQSVVDKAFLTTMVNAAKSIFVPYDVDGLTASAKDPLNLKISGVDIDASGTAKILWSWQQSGGRPYPINSAVTVPSEMRVPNTFLIRTELTASYPIMLFLPTTFSTESRNISMSREIFYQQRLNDNIPCSDC